jgi:hypothetical protein
MARWCPVQLWLLYAVVIWEHTIFKKAARCRIDQPLSNAAWNDGKMYHIHLADAFPVFCWGGLNRWDFAFITMFDHHQRGLWGGIIALVAYHLRFCHLLWWPSQSPSQGAYTILYQPVVHLAICWCRGPLEGQGKSSSRLGRANRCDWVIPFSKDSTRNKTDIFRKHISRPAAQPF